MLIDEIAPKHGTEGNLEGIKAAWRQENFLGFFEKMKRRAVYISLEEESGDQPV